MQKLGFALQSRGSRKLSTGDGSLSDTLSSTVFDLDATKSASYPGTGTTWANLVTAPADGAAQTDYNFMTGDGSTSTTYPTFTGSAGDPGAYWLFDGGDYFKKAAANTAFINNLHKTTGGQDFWFVATWFSPAVDSATDFLMDTRSTTSTDGMNVAQTAGEQIEHRQRGDAAAVAVTHTTVLAGSAIHIVIVSHSHSGNQTRIWIDSATAEEFAHTYDTTTDNASNIMILGGALNGTAGRIANGGRIYSVAMGNEYLDNTKAQALITTMNARHLRTYA